jgi:hypothetical protein
MPSIASRLDTSSPVGGSYVRSAQHFPSAPTSAEAAPVLSTTLRCPLPVVGVSSTSDNLRQYYAGGSIPQYRLTPVAPLSAAPKTAAPTGLSTTIVTAKLTVGGTNGSITLVNGILTSLVPAT